MGPFARTEKVAEDAISLALGSTQVLGPPSLSSLDVQRHFGEA